jgi:hypothetical protein
MSRSLDRLRSDILVVASRQRRLLDAEELRQLDSEALEVGSLAAAAGLPAFDESLSITAHLNRMQRLLGRNSAGPQLRHSVILFPSIVTIVGIILIPIIHTFDIVVLYLEVVLP